MPEQQDTFVSSEILQEPTPKEGPRAFSRWTDWEQWPWALFHLPLTFIWAAYCIRAGSLWFFSSSNPKLTFGGFEGEGKDEMYALLPDGTYPTTCYAEPTEPFEAVLARITTTGLQYPLVVKPNVGMKGLLFRKIEDEAQLARYHSICPGKYILQDYIEWPLEIGVFYYRMPNEEKGRITGFTQKTPPMVKGDGHSTLLSLIQKHPRGIKILANLQVKFKPLLNDVVAKGATIVLSEAGNRSQGGEITNLKHLIDEPLLDIFDRISHYNGDFFYGRYDIKCVSVEDLKAGRFSILEFNGAGAAPNHIYHCGNTIWQAWGGMVAHWDILYKLSRFNHRTGRARYWPFKKGLHFLREARQFLEVLKTADHQF